MKIGIPNQTGNLTFAVDLTAKSPSGDFTMGFGCEGISDKSLSFNLKNGEIRDGDGIFFGGYLPNRQVNISGVIQGQNCSYFLNGILVRSEYPVKNQDINFISLEKASGDNGNYSISYEVRGENPASDLNLLYISSGNESGIINILSGMSIFGGDSGVYQMHSEFGGTLSSDKISQIEDFDLVVFGQHVQSGLFTDKSGWASIETPIIFLNALAANQGNAGIISGELVDTVGDERIWGVAEINGPKKSVSDIVLRRLPTGIVNLFIAESQEFLSYPYEESGVVLYNNEGGSGMKMMDVFESGTTGAAGYSQNGRRAIFNAPCWSESGLAEIATDGWKKMLVSCVYEMVD